MKAQLSRDSWRKQPGKEAPLQKAFMLEGVPGGEQNFRWVLRLVCVLGALHSAHSAPAHPQRRGGRAAELMAPGCHTTHIYGMSDRWSGPHGPQRQGRTHLHAQSRKAAPPVSCSQEPWPVSPWLGLETGSPGPLRALVHVCVCV